MKKLFIGMLSFLLALMTICGFAACDNTSNTGKTSNNGSTNSHTHNYIESITQEANCSSSGTKKYSCSCGDSYTQSYSLESYTASEVYEKVKNSVGEITVYDKNGNSLALGTCFVYAKDGKILTNFHVIEDSYSAKVDINGTVYNVSKILAYDEEIDLAVLKISATNLTPINFCDKIHQVGKSVYAIGSSKGMTATFSQGIITTASRELDGVKYVQHDAAISSGNSGGPLINEYCEVIGINTMTLKDSQNLNFAISVSEIDNLDFSNPIDYGKHNPSSNEGATTPDSSSDLFVTMKNLAISKGEYEDGEYSYDFYESDNFVYGLKYDSADKTVTFTLFYINDDATYGDMIFIKMDKVDGIYDWNYVGGNLNSGTLDFMSGVLYASSWTSESVLTVSDYKINTYSTLSSLKTTASTSLDILLGGIEKYLKSYGITVKELGFTKFSSSTSTSSDMFTVMKNYAISKGTYDDGTYRAQITKTYSSDYSLSFTYYITYDSANKEMRLEVFGYSANMSYLVSIVIDEIDGVYDWSYIDSFNYYMSGEIIASTWTANSLLGYDYIENITTTTTRNNVRELASSSVNSILYAVNNYLTGNGITAKKIGFINF